METLLKVSEEVDIPLKSLLEVAQQAENGATAAFLARYRPDLCHGNGEDEVHGILERLSDLRDLDDRRISMLATLNQRGLMSEPLRQQLEKATDHRDLLDIYMPYREQKPGPAEEAIQNGLDPLARILWMQQEGVDIDAEVARYVDPDGQLKAPAEALEGAYAIAAKWLSDKPEIVRALRKLYMQDAEISVRARARSGKGPRVQSLDGLNSKAGKLDWRKQLMIRRGKRTGALQVDFVVPTEASMEFLERRLIQDPKSPYAPHLRQVVERALTNGLADRVRHSVQGLLDERAEERAIESYRKDLRRALLAPPATGLNILGIEIARSGEWHAALVDSDGKLAECAVVRSDRDNWDSDSRESDTPPAKKDAADPASAAADTGDDGEKAAPAPKKKRKARIKRVRLADFLSTRTVDLIICAAGARPHLAEEHVRSQIRKASKLDLPWRVVRDPGARIFSRGSTARRLYRRLPSTFVTAATMARRVQDPLAEIARADFRSAGLGVNYLEVNSERLREAHSRTLTAVLCELGVDVNRASAAMLGFVPGLNDRAGRRIVAHRRKHGPFATREDLAKVEGLSGRAYAQAVGFLRVEGADPLDRTCAHPEYRELYESIAEAAECDLETLLKEPERLEALDAEELAGPDRSIFLVRSAFKDLGTERRKERATFTLPERSVPLRTDEELQPGTKVSGVVSNTQDFGAFVDIGANQDGFLHVSQIDREFLSDARPTLRQGDAVEVFIRPPMEGGRRIGLTMRPQAANARNGMAGRSRGRFERPGFRRGRKPRGGRFGNGKPFRKVFGPDSRSKKRKGRRERKLTLSEKLNLLSDRYRTRV